MLQKVWFYSGPRKPLIFAVLLAASALEGAGLILLLPIANLVFSDTQTSGSFAQMVEIFFAQIGIENSISRLTVLCGLFLALLFLRATVMIRRDAMLASLTHGFVDQTRKEFFTVVARADWSVLKRIDRSHLLNNMTTNISRVSVALQFFSKSVITLMMIIAYVVAGFFVNWSIGSLLLLIIGLGGVTAAIWSKRSGKLGSKLTMRNRLVLDETTRFLDGLKTAQAYQAVDVFVERFSSSIDQVRHVSVQFVRQQGRLRWAVEMLGATVAVALLLVGYGLLELSGAELLVMGAVLIRLTPNLISLLSGVQSLAYALPAFSASEELRVSLLGVPSSENQNERAEPLVGLGPISFQDVKAKVTSDGTETCILQISDIKFPQHGFVHLGGPSGAGKSTMAELLAGIDLPSEGKVTTPTLPLNSVNRTSWQSCIAFVPQEPFLFSGSVRENLCWPNIDASDDELWKALETAVADDLVRGLSDGLDNLLMDNGARLSGGERQRLCLARALLRKSEVLIVDEGTSAVDSVLEDQILGNLLRLAKSQLVVFVSHSAKAKELADHHIAISQDGHAKMRQG